ncbi:MAG: hypothetical protein P8Y70_17240, partial [Candidatus Lokiarchaeota archaeon]
MVRKLYEKEKEERNNYLKITEKERKESFEKSQQGLEKSIGEKAFRIEQRRKADEDRKNIKPDMKGTSEKIEKSIGEKAFRIEQRRKADEDR